MTVRGKWTIRQFEWYRGDKDSIISVSSIELGALFSSKRIQELVHEFLESKNAGYGRRNL